jgi:peptidoglycan hydrolase CwlO-like protein
MNDLPISEAITGVVAAAIAWITGGKYAAKSTEIDNTAKLIEIWEKANHNCQKELDEMREEIRVVRLEAGAERERLNDEVAKLQQKVRVLESHIKKLETK